MIKRLWLAISFIWLALSLVGIEGPLTDSALKFQLFMATLPLLLGALLWGLFRFVRGH